MEQGGAKTKHAPPAPPGDICKHIYPPDEAWWSDFYTPMEARIGELREQYADDADALTILDQLAEEPDMHRRYSDYYAYVFFVARRPLVRS